MIKRRGRNLDLPAQRETPVGGQHQPQNLPLFAPHQGLIRQTEIAALFDQVAHFRIVLLELLVKPGQLRQDLQVPKRLAAERAPRALDVPAGCLPGVIQLAIARIAVNHALRIGVKRVSQQEPLLAFGQVFSRFESRLQKRIGRHAPRVLVHLHHHRRHQVERLAHLRKLLQDLDHAVVIFQRMHARPGQLILARDQVLVKRLMHVPKETEMDTWHFIVRTSS